MIPKDNLDHKSFPQPSDTECSVWRYMDFAKFIALLDTQALYYCRADHLDDAFEGCVGSAADASVVTLLGAVQASARQHYVSCWCRHEYESDALWRIYATGPSGGIAIRSKYSDLVMALPESDYIGLITYSDYDAETFDLTNLFNFVMNKRTQFSYEQEVRIVRPPFAIPSWKESSGPNRIDVSKLPTGFPVRADIDSIVDAAVVSPYAPDWFFDAVSAAVHRFGSCIPVEHSTLARKPFVDTLDVSPTT